MSVFSSAATTWDLAAELTRSSSKCHEFNDVSAQKSITKGASVTYCAPLRAEVGPIARYVAALLPKSRQ